MTGKNTMEKAKCSCGCEFAQKFCPECGRLHPSLTKPEPPAEKPPISDGVWWRRMGLVGTYECTVEHEQERAHLTLTADGDVCFVILYPAATVVYVGTLRAESEGAVVLRREDGRGIGSGHACQPRCGATIAVRPGNRLHIDSKPLPPPISFSGFSYDLARISEKVEPLAAVCSGGTEVSIGQTLMKTAPIGYEMGCGVQPRPARICTVCGAASAYSGRFCPECGARFSAAEK